MGKTTTRPKSSFGTAQEQASAGSTVPPAGKRDVASLGPVSAESPSMALKTSELSEEAEAEAVFGAPVPDL